MRKAAALLLVAACRAPTPAAAPGAAPAEVEGVDDDDPTDAWLRLYDEAGLPSVAGRPRIVQRGFNRTCQRAWVLADGAHRTLFHDTLAIDYGGAFFESWPAWIRRPEGAYDQLESRVATRVAIRHRGPSGHDEHPGDLVVESVRARQGGDECSAVRGPPFATEASRAIQVLAHARWLQSLGQDRLAHETIAPAAGEWTEDGLRTEMAGLLVEIAHSAFAQGVPRAMVASHLRRARAMCSCEHAVRADELLERLGDDPPFDRPPADADAWAALLAEDLVFPGRDYVRPDFPPLPWGERVHPRSPGWELVAIGWASLPALVRVGAEVRLGRRLGGVRIDRDGRSRSVWTTTDVLALRVAESIALRSFADHAGLRGWWNGVSSLDEWTAHSRGLRDPDAWLGEGVTRMLDLDPVRTVDAFAGFERELPANARIEALTALVAGKWPDPRTPAHREARATLERVLRANLRAGSLRLLAPTARGLVRLRARGWTRAVERRIRAVVPDVTDDHEEAIAAILGELLRADPPRALALLRDLLARPEPVAVAAAETALFGACEEDGDARCTAAVKRLHVRMQAMDDGEMEAPNGR